MTRTTLIALLVSLFALCLSVLSCTEPDVSKHPVGVGERCNEDPAPGEDLILCGPGSICITENHLCVPSFNNMNGVYDDRVVVAFVGDVGETGPIKDLGNGLVIGIQAYFHHVNTTDGGVYGRQLELLTQDDEFDVTTSEQLISGLISQRNVLAFLGSIAPTESTVEMLATANIVLFGAYTGGGVTRQDPPARSIFNFQTSYEQEAQAQAGYLLEVREPHLNNHSIAFFGQTASAFVAGSPPDYEETSSTSLDGLLDAIELESSQVLRVGYQRGTTDVGAAAAEIMMWAASDEPQAATDGSHTYAVVMLTSPNAGAGLIQAVVDDLETIKTSASAVGERSSFGLSAEQEQAILDRNVNLVFSSASTVGTGLGMILGMTDAERYCAQTEVLISQVVPHFTSSATGVQNYRAQLQAYASAMGMAVEPEFMSLYGYLIARTFVEGLRNAGPDITDLTLVEGILDIQNLDLGIGHPATFTDNDHQALHNIWGSRLGATCSTDEWDFE